MKRAIIAALVAFSLTTHAQTRPTRPNYEFINGKWFDGQRFVSKTFYSVNGLLTSRKPSSVDHIFDLTGKYVVPPFGEAHNHNLNWSSDLQFERVKNKYLAAGVFYVKNPNSLLRVKADTDAHINSPTTIDAVLANGGLTASGGHPIEIVSSERGFRPGDGEGGFYYVIDSAADLKRKWPSIKAGKPDFIKTYLLYSEEYAKRKNDKAYDGWKGLDPSVLQIIVQRAHKDGLRVSTHVESAIDFHNALLAGADEINHMPGFRPDRNDTSSYKNLKQYEISESDARLAKWKHVVVVTTLGEALEMTFNDKFDEQGRLALRGLLVRNLQLLASHGVSIAIGSDDYRGTSLEEALSIAKVKAFDNPTLLRMWCETTASAIFPKRRIGRLKEQYEASFLVLTKNPLDDFQNVKTIELRVKQGVLLP